jgi:glycosyltransferase involved in cell wall biosynthesis
MSARDLARPLRILLLSDGDPESWSAWSGITKNLVTHLRLAGHAVDVGDVDVRSTDRLIAAATTFSRDRRRWGTRYHLGAIPFRLRSERAARLVNVRGLQCDVVVQIGATFESRSAPAIPYCVCSDSNILVAGQAVATGHTDAAALSDADVAGIRAREARVYQGAAALFPLSERLRQSFVEDFGIPAHRVHAIHAGPNLDPNRVTRGRERPTADRQPTILFVGLQFQRKGGDVLVQSFRQVRQQIGNARLVLAGVPVGFIDEPGVTCLGVLDKNKPEDAAALAAAYDAADVFALPTRFEPFGIAFVEAMHFGLPCIGPRAWAVPEIIDDGETGFTIPIDDVAALTDRLLRLLRSPALAQSMGAAGQRKAQRLFTWPRVVDRMTDVLFDIVGGPVWSGRSIAHGRHPLFS